MRTIILSDIHGYPHLINNVLEHSEYDKDKDRLIFIGDWSDRGPESAACFKILKDNDAIILFGNHEAAHIFQMGIQPYDDTLDENVEITLELFDGLLNNNMFSAYEVDGFLLTHAGLSRYYLEEVLYKKYDMMVTAKDIANAINREQQGILEVIDDNIVIKKKPEIFLNYLGPYWFRPFELDPNTSGLASVKQVFGHSYATYYTKTQKKQLVDNNHYNIDPCCSMFRTQTDHGVYVVIEDGNIKYIDIKNNIKFIEE